MKNGTYPPWLLLTASFLLAACEPPTADSEPLATSGSAMSPVIGSRPLVAIVASLPGSFAPRSGQWESTTTLVGKPILDNQAVTSEEDFRDYTPCSAIFELGFVVTTTHTRVADLVIDVSTLSRQSGAVLATERLWNGPAAAASAGSAAAANALALPELMYAKKLMHRLPGNMGASPECSRFRLTVRDVTSGNTGTLLSWQPRRRKAGDPVPPLDYFRQLFFGPSNRNVNDYFREESRYQFSFANAGIYRTTWNNWQRAVVPLVHDAETALSAEAVLMLEQQGFDFARYDSKPRDGTITTEELTVVAVFNHAHLNMTRVPSQTDASGQQVPCVKLTRWPQLRFCGKVVTVGAEPSFPTLVHELTHTLQGNRPADLYYTALGDMCHDFSIMSCTSFDPGSRQKRYADPWHRSKLGWYTSRSMTPDAGVPEYMLGDERYIDFYGNRARPAILRRNASNDREHYLFEYRSGQGYDADIGSPGVVIWHVQEGADGNLDGSMQNGDALHPVGPGNQKWSSRAWTPSDGVFRLRWADGTEIPFNFWIQDVAGGDRALLRWSNRPAPQVSIARPANEITTTTGLGNPLVFEATLRDFQGGSTGFTQRWTAERVDANNVTVPGSLFLLGVDNPSPQPVITPGRYRVTVRATDRFGGFASASIYVTIKELGPPWVRIDAPTANATFTRGQPVTLQGAAGTGDQLALPCEKLTWTIAGVAGIWTGCTAAPSINLSGKVVITLTATDEPRTASTTVSINLVEPLPDAPPVVSFVKPELNFRLNAFETHDVQGLVQDARGGPVTYRWTVFDRWDGREVDLSTSSFFRWKPADHVRSFSSGDTLELRLYGTNSRGQTTMGVRTGVVNFPPR